MYWYDVPKNHCLWTVSLLFRPYCFMVHTRSWYFSCEFCVKIVIWSLTYRALFESTTTCLYELFVELISPHSCHPCVWKWPVTWWSYWWYADWRLLYGSRFKHMSGFRALAWFGIIIQCFFVRRVALRITLASFVHACMPALANSRHDSLTVKRTVSQTWTALWDNLPFHLEQIQLLAWQIGFSNWLVRRTLQ